MGPIWGRQDPGGPHVGPLNFAIWDLFQDGTNSWSVVSISDISNILLLYNHVSKQVPQDTFGWVRQKGHTLLTQGKKKHIYTSGQNQIYARTAFANG